MKYTVNMTTSQGKSKTIVVEATGCKDAASIASDKYPNSEIGRVSASVVGLDYFKTIKDFKKR